MSNETKSYYFQVYESGDAIVRVVQLDEDGMEVSYSDHSTNDESIADGDGSACAPDWSDAQAWTKTTLEHANTMLQFDLDEDELLDDGDPEDEDEKVDKSVVEHYDQLDAAARKEYRENTLVGDARDGDCISVATAEQLDAIDAGRKPSCLA